MTLLNLNQLLYISTIYFLCKYQIKLNPLLFRIEESFFYYLRSTAICLRIIKLILLKYLYQMSIVSFKSSKEKQGFTPYQSVAGDVDLRQISLFSKLSLNEVKFQEPSLRFGQYQQSSIDILSVRSRKRRGSEQIMKQSKIGNKTFLNRSLIGKSSLNHDDQNQLGFEEIDDEGKKELSENSCPVGHLEERSFYVDQEETVRNQFFNQKPRFTKTKNLLRNISSYFHKFLIYNKRAYRFFIKYFKIKYQNLNKDENSNTANEDKDTAFSSMDEQNYVQQSIQQFQEWVKSLSLVNFADYEAIWTEDHKFKCLYRQLCFKYYKEEAYCDIQRSRLLTKEISNTYMPQFIEGLIEPKQFFRFK